MTITKKKFKADQAVRESGVTNMCAITRVIEAAELIYDVELTKEDCLLIMGNYEKLVKKYSKINEKICKKLAK